MVIATITRGPSGYVAFDCKGHAGYLEKGKDIVCSAISMLAINTANSIMTLTDTGIDVKEEDGFISWTFTDIPDEKATLLMDSLQLGLLSVVREYGKNYLKLEIKEVKP